jgi:poly(A) polymerase
MISLPFATSIVKKLTDAGHTAYFAGGWVRDYLLQHPSDDIDIATSASVEEIQSLFPKTVPVGIAFGIVVVIEGGHSFEVATFRKESGYLDGRRPTTVTSATPEEDAKRRDFTINGMFWDPLNKVLYDYVGGQEDLKQQVIRAIGDPHERFLEDRLRMMRAVRYSTRFHFPIELSTKQAILSHAESLFPSVAMERVWQEFKKMAQFAHFDRSLLSLHELNLLPTIFPKLRGVSLEEIGRRLKPLSLFPPQSPPIAELIELFPQPSLEELFELCDYLKLSRSEKECVNSLHRAEQLLSMPPEWQLNLEPAEWAHFYADPYAALALRIKAAHLPEKERDSFLSSHEMRRVRLQNAIHRIQQHTPVVRAEHLIQEGISPGKRMGILLKEAERIAVREGLETAAEVISLLKKSSLWHN